MASGAERDTHVFQTQPVSSQPRLRAIVSMGALPSPRWYLKKSVGSYGVPGNR